MVLGSTGRSAAWVAIALGACSVFPDRAVLPDGEGDGLSSGGSAPTAGTSGESGAANGDGGARAGSSNEGGAAGSTDGGVGAGSGEGGVAGASGESGAAGSNEDGGGGGSCAAEQRLNVEASAATFIDSAEPTATHGEDVALSLGGATPEARILLAFTLPSVPSASHVAVELELQVEANADATGAARRFGAFRLERGFDERHATWERADTGSGGGWLEAGGDTLGDAATGLWPAETSSGTLRFDVSSLLGALAGTELNLLVRETGEAPPAPAALRLTSDEGLAGAHPRLTVSYCPP